MTQATVERRTDWKEPRSGRSAAWLAVLLIVALAITLAGIFPFRQLLAQQRQVESTEAKLEALVMENERLAEEAELLQTQPEIERVAREELGLVRPGETGYRVEVPPTREEPPSEVPSVQPVDDRTIVEKIWDFLTGRDLAPDG